MRDVLGDEDLAFGIASFLRPFRIFPRGKWVQELDELHAGLIGRAGRVRSRDKFSRRLGEVAAPSKTLPR